jgi:hypothetical protein
MSSVLRRQDLGTRGNIAAIRKFSWVLTSTMRVRAAQHQSRHGCSHHARCLSREALYPHDAMGAQGAPFWFGGTFPQSRPS